MCKRRRRTAIGLPVRAAEKVDPPSLSTSRDDARLGDAEGTPPSGRAARKDSSQDRLLEDNRHQGRRNDRKSHQVNHRRRGREREAPRLRSDR